jgi:hypothetical protein
MLIIAKKARQIQGFFGSPNRLQQKTSRGRLLPVKSPMNGFYCAGYGTISPAWKKANPACDFFAGRTVGMSACP